MPDVGAFKHTDAKMKIVEQLRKRSEYAAADLIEDQQTEIEQLRIELKRANEEIENLTRTAAKQKRLDTRK